MAIIFTDGFDHYSASTEIYRRWTTSIHDIASLQTGRFGGKAIRQNGGGFVDGLFICPNGTDTATLVVGVAFRTSSFAATCCVVSLRDGSLAGQVQVGVCTDTSGHLRIYRGTTATIVATGTTALSLNTWYYIELKATVHNTTGAYTLRIDGVNELTASGVNTRATANNYANMIGLDCGVGTNDFDDLYIADTTGSSPQNDLFGPIQIDWKTPSADTAQKDFTPDTGTANFSRVNETIADTTNYVSGSAAGKDLYAMTGAMTIEPTTIFAIKTVVLAQQMSSGARTIRGICKSSATTQNGTTKAINADSAYLDDILPTNPNGSIVWRASAINALQVGEEIVT